MWEWVVLGVAAVLAGAVGGFAGSWWLRHRSSDAVRRWSPPAGDRRRAGPLAVRVRSTTGAGGPGDPADPMGADRPVLLLLHGILGSGDAYGAGFDALAADGLLVVPDLLGFGDSLDVAAPRPDLADHLDALDSCLADLGLTDRPTVVVGHSGGGTLGLQWAARAVGRRPGAVRAVVAFSPSLYDGAAEADESVRRAGWFEALMAGDGPLPRRLCGWMERHPRAAAWGATAVNPALPVPVARAAVRHCWASYSGALDALVRSATWDGALGRLSDAGVPVLLVGGTEDPLLVPGRLDAVAAAHPTVRTRWRAGVHDIPLADPAWCVEVIRDALARGSQPKSARVTSSQVLTPTSCPSSTG